MSPPLNTASPSGEPDEPLYSRWRCSSCGFVSESVEPYPDLVDVPCTHCGGCEHEGVAETVPLTPEPEAAEYGVWFMVPGTGEIAAELAFTTRGAALHHAHTLAWHEAYRVSDGQAAPYWDIEVSSREGTLFLASRDVHCCEHCGEISVRTLRDGTCVCGTPYPIAALGPRSRESGLAG